MHMLSAALSACSVEKLLRTDKNTTIQSIVHDRETLRWKDCAARVNHQSSHLQDINGVVNGIQ